MKWIRSVDANVAIAFCVMLVSFSTMFITMYQASIMNRQTEILLQQTKANAWPCLRIGKTEMGSKDKRAIETYYFSLTNNGTGPAIIEGVRVSYLGRPVANWNALVETMQTPDSVSRSRTFTPISQGVISANSRSLIVDYSGNLDLIEWMKRKGHDVLVEVYYRSVFGDMWKIEKRFDNATSTYPEKVEQCDIPESERFEN